MQGGNTNFKSSKLIYQCKKCHAHGHSQRYCAREVRCQAKMYTLRIKSTQQIIADGMWLLIYKKKIENEALNTNKHIKNCPLATKKF